MEVYQKAMQAIERERINFLDKIDLVQPSFDEQHQLEVTTFFYNQNLEISKRYFNSESVVRAIYKHHRSNTVRVECLPSKAHCWLLLKALLHTNVDM